MEKAGFREKDIFYEVHGQGAPVVLLHGFGENNQVFSRQTALLKDHFKVILPDLPGSGKSDAADGQPEIDDFAEAVLAVTEKEIPGLSFHLFGHSMGGYITMAFAEKYAEKLLSFGLLHSSAYGDTEQKKESRKKAVKFIEQHGGQAFLKTITDGLFSEESLKAHPEFSDELMEESTGIQDETLIKYYQAMVNRPDRTSVLRNTPLPVLFIIGRYDSVVPLELSREQSKFPSSSTARILDHSGHMGMWEETDMFNRHLIGFLSQF